MAYLCSDCCTKLHTRYFGMCVNEVGRKVCRHCGDNSEWELSFVSDEEYDELIKQPELI